MIIDCFLRPNELTNREVKLKFQPFSGILFAIFCFLWMGADLHGQTTFQFSSFRRLTNQETFLNITAPTGLNYRVDVSTNLMTWDGFLTFLSTSNGLQHTDSAAPFLSSRMYRARQLTGTNIVTGEHLPTTNGDVIIHPIYHASTALSWSNRMVYVDPSTNHFTGLPLA